MRCAMKEVKNSGMRALGSNVYDTCNGVFGKCYRQGELLSKSDGENYQKALQKIIPD